MHPVVVFQIVKARPNDFQPGEPRYSSCHFSHIFCHGCQPFSRALHTWFATNTSLSSSANSVLIFASNPRLYPTMYMRYAALKICLHINPWLRFFHPSQSISHHKPNLLQANPKQFKGLVVTIIFTCPIASGFVAKGFFMMHVALVLQHLVESYF